MKCKAYLSVLIAFLAVISATADDVTNTEGRIYYNVTVTRVEPDGITYSHSGGVVKLFFWELPQDIQTRYGYDAQKAKQYQMSVSRNQAAFAQQQEQAFKKRDGRTPKETGKCQCEKCKSESVKI